MRKSEQFDQESRLDSNEKIRQQYGGENQSSTGEKMTALQNRRKQYKHQSQIRKAEVRDMTLHHASVNS